MAALLAFVSGLSWSPRELRMLHAEQPPIVRETALALRNVRDADPLEFARVVTRLGDSAVLPLMGENQPGAVRLAAIRASRWLVMPEHALPALVELIVGRDSLLAPAAAQSTLEIVRGLDADALARREADPAELGAVLAALRAAAEKPQVRADLRMMVAESAALLEASLVPASTAR